jgi:hypothetical protein
LWLGVDPSVRDPYRKDQRVLVQISADNRISKFVEPKSRSFPFAETLTPARAIYKATEARGAYAIGHLRQEADDQDVVYTIGLRQGRVTLPLGWILAGASKRDMDEQLKAILRPCSEEEGRKKPLEEFFRTCLRR